MLSNGDDMVMKTELLLGDWRAWELKWRALRWRSGAASKRLASVTGAAPTRSLLFGSEMKTERWSLSPGWRDKNEMKEWEREGGRRIGRACHFTPAEVNLPLPKDNVAVTFVSLQMWDITLDRSESSRCEKSLQGHLQHKGFHTNLNDSLTVKHSFHTVYLRFLCQIYFRCFGNKVSFYLIIFSKH